MENVVEDTEITSTSTAELNQPTVTAPESPGTIDLDPVHNEDQVPVAQRSHNNLFTRRWKRFKFILHSSILPKRNKQSLHYYGSEAALERECARQEAGGRWVIHPLSALRFYYVLYMVAITFENLISIPVEMVFHEEEESSSQLGFSIFCDVMFLVDIVLNFRMGILREDSEEAVLDLQTIKMTYLQTWFIPDLLSSFPIDIILLITEHQSMDETPLVAGKIIRILMFLRIMSMLRLVRVSRLVNFFNEIEMGSKANLKVPRLFIRIILISIIVFLACHWNGCMQYFVSMVMDFPEDCWVHAENLLNNTLAEKYSFSQLRAISHMSSISCSSTDPPTSVVEIWVVVLSMAFGIMGFTMLLAHFSDMMSDMGTPCNNYMNNVNLLEDYMLYRRLPKQLKNRITKYYKMRYRGKWFDEKTALDMVSIDLKEEILVVMCGTLLKKVPMFKDQSANFIKAVLFKLTYEVFEEGDVIFKQDTPEDRTFFINNGHVSVGTDCFQWELCDGDYFGEVCLLEQGLRAFTARALSPCQLFSLSVDSLHQVLHSFPQVREQLEGAGIVRQEDLRMAEHQKTTEEDE